MTANLLKDFSVVAGNFSQSDSYLCVSLQLSVQYTCVAAVSATSPVDYNILSSNISVTAASLEHRITKRFSLEKPFLTSNFTS